MGAIKMLGSLVVCAVMLGGSLLLIDLVNMMAWNFSKFFWGLIF